MTPCEKIGLKVGDKIRVLQEGRLEPVGSVLTLISDDGSTAPRFETEGGDTTYFGVVPSEYQKYLPEGQGWERVVDEEHSLTKQLHFAIIKRNRQYVKARRHAENLKQSEAEIQRLVGALEREIEESTGMPCRIGGTGLPDPQGVIERFNCRCVSVSNISECVDPDDPKTWKEWDEIICIESSSQYFTEGRVYEFNRIDPRDGSVEVKRDDAGDTYGSPGAKFRFIRRPS